MSQQNAFKDIERIFHEPSRMAIMSTLLGQGAMSFTELRDACRLTDGNLSRHLSALEGLRAVKIHKSFVDAKPRTTVSVTDKGRDRFLRYLAALKTILEKADQAAGASAPFRGIRDRPATA